MRTPAPLPLSQDIVLIGGGHAHALVLRRWGMAPVPGVRLTLVTPQPTAPYTGMLPGLVAGAYTRADLEINLVRLARFAGARLILDRATGIDRTARTITLAGRPPLDYDIASLDIGITSVLPDLPGFAHHGISAKPLDRFAQRWEEAAHAMARGAQAPQIAVLGAGLGGVELALAMSARLRTLGLSAPQITLIDRGRALKGVSKRSRTRLLGALAAAAIALVDQTDITRIEARALVRTDGPPIPSTFTVSAAGAQPHPWLAETGLALERGFVRVRPDLRSETDPAIYAVGDCAHLSHAPRPKAGVFAVRQAPVLAWNLGAEATGAARRPYRPQSNTLKLVKLAGQEALADWAGVSGAGPVLWRWKDRIDRAFMRKLNELPWPSQPPLPRGGARLSRAHLAGRPPLCGGCGAKLASQTLHAGLSATSVAEDPRILQGPGDDAALVQVGDAVQVLSVDHLRPPVLDPHLFAQLTLRHAMGDVWAMGARPDTVLASVTLPPGTPRLHARMLREVMAGLDAATTAAGARIIGGHSAEGPELSLSLTVTGLADAPPVCLSGAEPGDVLILSDRLGTGLLLAAEMQGKAHAHEIAPLWAEMARLPTEAAPALARAHAATDITGFGLVGHACQMAERSGVALTITCDAVPLWPGARRLAAAALRPSLFAANLQAAQAATTGLNPERVEDICLVDPQTCGPFLLAVAEDQVARCLADLGAHARVIGAVHPGTGVSLR